MIAYDIMEIKNTLLGHDYDCAWEMYTMDDNSPIYVLGKETGAVTIGGFCALGSMSKSFACNNGGGDNHLVMEGLNYLFSVYGLAGGDMDKVSNY
eukprot:11037407-Ditylum_brightwellii.AAC.1